MFQKIIIVEDFDTDNQQLVQFSLENLNVQKVEHAQYCDEGLLKIRKAVKENTPYELLITDLIFNEDHRIRKLKSGQELIAEALKIQPELKIIVFSSENQSSKIKQLIDTYPIQGFVSKSRKGLKELQDAVGKVANNKNHFSEHVSKLFKLGKLWGLKPEEKQILCLLADGHSKAEVSIKLNKLKIQGSSVSSIEKKLKRLCELHDAKNTTHLIALAQRERIIE